MSHYIRYLIVSPKEVLDFLPEDGWPSQQMYFGKIINMESIRYQVFKRNRKCVFCGIEGVYMALEQDRGSCRLSQSPHFNLYTITNLLMTKDHIIPKSLGGKDSLNNLQCACSMCNCKKSNKLKYSL
jgi:5-methylcytosine-specific restriction endonuclease McrA